MAEVFRLISAQESIKTPSFFPCTNTARLTTRSFDLTSLANMIAPTSHTDLPPFPDGLPLAPIAKISHAKLLQHDKDEAARVLEACRTHGFFYLDLMDSESGEEILKQSKPTFLLVFHTDLREYGNANLEERMDIKRPSCYLEA
jgi:hypothetical protein